MKRVLRSAILAFAVSRAVFFGLWIVGSQIAFEKKVYSNSVWETRIVLRSERVIPELSRVAMSGDAWYYRSIALDGYTPKPVTQPDGTNWAFFPLFPLLVRAVLPADGNFALAGMLLSNAAFLGALVLVGGIALKSGASEEGAERAVWYLAAFPTSYFCSLPLPEGLFLLLSSGSFYAATTDRWPVAGVLGALAAATRFAGILLLPALVLLAIERHSRVRRSIPWLLLIPAGTAAFMIHLQRVTGSAWAFVRVQSQWDRQAAAPWSPIVAAVANWPEVSVPWNFVALNLACVVLLLAVAVALLRDKRWSLATYTLGSILVPISTGTLQSFGRYTCVVFPLYLVLAQWGRRPNVDRTILAMSLLLAGWLAAMFLLRVDFALA